MYVYVYVCNMCVDTHSALGPQKLELQAAIYEIVSMWILGTKLSAVWSFILCRVKKDVYFHKT